MPVRGAPSEESLPRALVLMHRYSVALTHIATAVLADRWLENRDGQVFTTLCRSGRLSPTQLLRELAASRSTVSRSLGRLESAGLTRRVPDPADGRGVLVVLTPRGRRRAAALDQRLGQFFDDALPLVKDTCTELGIDLPGRDEQDAVDALQVLGAMTAVGARYVEDVTPALAPFGIREPAERHALALTHLYGVQRPTLLAEELALCPSGVSGLLTRLAGRDLITRRHDDAVGDRRAVLVELTERGHMAAQVQLAVFAQHAPALAHAISQWAGR